MEAVHAGLQGQYEGPKLICHVGGRLGCPLAALLRDRPQAKGIVFDLPEAAGAGDAAITAKDGLVGRIDGQGGGMFEADIYLLKHIPHGWDDGECRQILRVVRRGAWTAVGALPMSRMGRNRRRRSSSAVPAGHSRSSRDVAAQRNRSIL